MLWSSYTRVGQFWERTAATSGYRICPPFPLRELSGVQVWSENFVLVSTKHVSTIFDSLDNDGFAEEMTGRCSVLYCIRVVFTVVNSPFFSVCSVTLSYQRTKIVFSKNLLYKACKSTSISVGIMINIIWFCMFSVTGADEFKPVSRQLTQSTTSREWRQKIIVKHEPCPG